MVLVGDVFPGTCDEEEYAVGVGGGPGGSDGLSAGWSSAPGTGENPDEDKLIQHRIINVHDMEEYHKSVLDPGYCDVKKAEHDALVQGKKRRGEPWFD